jgi:hydroxymethylglutaryl-CoA reductase
LSDSQISGLYRLTLAERIGELQRCGWLSAEQAQCLRQGRYIISSSAADKVIENVVGVFGLPLAVAPNFLVNGRDFMVPMVVEEPSVVAGTSSAAKLARNSGGFTVECSESLLAGQVYVTEFEDVQASIAALNESRSELLDLANAVHPRLQARGGGAREIEVRRIQLDDSKAAIAVHILVDTCDAMGANMVNEICESIAPRIAELCDGKIALRILSNMTDRSLVVARACFRLADLATNGVGAESVRDGIILASRIAAADPYRASTHNKGVMNGIDALAIATGNDWRAIEAGAHAYAAESGQYSSLTVWSANDDGDLVGEIRIPLKVGIVGGTLATNPAAAACVEISGVASARELAELMAAVGLAQNFAALKALASSGIQHGHMRLHARSVVAAAGAPNGLFEEVVSGLIDEGDISISRAREMLADKQLSTASGDGPIGIAAGKIILLGEHAVVYGKHALAIPIVNAVRAEISESATGLTVSVADWGLVQEVDTGAGATGISAAITLIMKELGVSGSGYAVRIRSEIPPAMGLGASASIAVAITRAFNERLSLGRSDQEINAIAFNCEKLAHGRPSGVDNTVATFGEPILFSNQGSLHSTNLELTEPLPLVVACSSESGVTRDQVAAVRRRYDQNPTRYGRIFEEMGELSQSGAAALAAGDYAELGLLMNICHGLLNAIGVSTPELELMVATARSNGAIGAKLTGSGGGGSIVALCPGTVDAVAAAFQTSGFKTLSLDGR